MLDSRELEVLSGRSPSGLRLVVDALPIPAATKGKPRVFTVGDAVLVLVAVALETRGFAPAAARHLVREVAREIISLIVDDSHRAWAVAWADESDAGMAFRVVHDAARGLDVVLAQEDVDAVSVIDLRKLVADALSLILIATRRAGRGNADVA